MEMKLFVRKKWDGLGKSAHEGTLFIMWNRDLSWTPLRHEVILYKSTNIHWSAVCVCACICMYLLYIYRYASNGKQNHELCLFTNLS